MAQPLKYKVQWTVVVRCVDKPDASQTVTLEVPGLQDALTLARDLFVRHTVAGNQLDVAVTTPAGNSFVEWHLDALPF